MAIPGRRGIGVLLICAGLSWGTGMGDGTRGAFGSVLCPAGIFQPTRPEACRSCCPSLVRYQKGPTW